MARRVQSITLICSIAMACRGGIAAPCPRQESDELSSRVVEAQRALFASIRTFSATIAIRDGDNIEPSVRGEYQRSDRFVRVREHYPDGRIQHHLATGTHVLSLSETQGGFAASRRSITDPFCQCDVWRSMLLTFNGVGSARVPLESLLQLESRHCAWSRVTSGGVACIRLEIGIVDPDAEVRHLQIDFDSTHSFLARRLVVWPEHSPSYRSIWEITEFANVDGIGHFPISRKTTAYDGRRVIGEVTATLENVVFNEPLPPDAGVIRFPEGTLMGDRIEGRLYPVNSAGERIADGERLVTHPIVLKSPDQSVSMMGQSAPPGMGLWWWIGGASLLLLGVAALAKAWQARTSHGRL